MSPTDGSVLLEPDATGDEDRERVQVGGTEGETTGDERVDAALAGLAGLDDAPLTGHPEIFQDVHRRLQDTLAGIDDDSV